MLIRDAWCHRCLRLPRMLFSPAKRAAHIVPPSEGGAEFDPANGWGLCRPCFLIGLAGEKRASQEIPMTD